jgi:hypothetical protein
LFPPGPIAQGHPINIEAFPFAEVAVGADLTNLHHQFPEIGAGEQAKESLWGIFQPVDNILPVFDFPLGQPNAHVADKGRNTVTIIADNETLNLQAAL